VIKELQAWYRHPKSDANDWDCGLASAAIRYFGSWHQALGAAGLEPRRFRKWTKQRVIDAIQDRHVRGLAITRIERRNRTLVAAAREYFGGWKGALEAAGLTAHYVATRAPRIWTPDSVISEIRAFKQHGWPLTKVWQKDPTLYSAAKKHFGTWRAALQAAGYQPTRRVWTRQVILSEIQARMKQRLSLSSGASANKNLAAAAQRHFGSWRQALREAEPARRRSDEERRRCHVKK
jgi:hypothetical protein